jgi:hypothetical protein
MEVNVGERRCLRSLKKRGCLWKGVLGGGCEQGCAWEEREAQLGIIRVGSFTTLLLLRRVFVVLGLVCFFAMDRPWQVLGRGGEIHVVCSLSTSCPDFLIKWSMKIVIWPLIWDTRHEHEWKRRRGKVHLCLSSRKVIKEIFKPAAPGNITWPLIATAIENSLLSNNLPFPHYKNSLQNTKVISNNTKHLIHSTTLSSTSSRSLRISTSNRNRNLLRRSGSLDCSDQNSHDGLCSGLLLESGGYDCESGFAALDGYDGRCGGGGGCGDGGGGYGCGEVGGGYC